MTGRGDKGVPPPAVAILLAAGRGSRSGQETNKVFFPLAGATVLERAASCLLSHPGISSLVLVLAEKDREEAGRLLAKHWDPQCFRLTQGGHSRQESAYKGLLAARAWMDERGQGQTIALIHDAARCFLPPPLITDLLETIKSHHCGAAPVLELTDTVRLMDSDGLSFEKTLPRERLAAMQTPQGADLDVLLRAADLAWSQGLEVTDDIELLLRIGYPVRAVRGDAANLKLTLPEDFVYARFLFGEGGLGPVVAG